MEYRIEFAQRAARDFLKLSPEVQRRVGSKVDSLAADPRPPGWEKLSGIDAYRIRSGDYRVVYLVDDVAQIVTIARVGHRRDIYRRL